MPRPESLTSSRAVGLIDATDYLGEALSSAFQDVGFQVHHQSLSHLSRSGAAQEDFFLGKNLEGAVCHITTPYRENWTYASLMKSRFASERFKFVMTTRVLKALQAEVPSADAIQLEGDPHGIDLVLVRFSKFYVPHPLLAPTVRTNVSSAK